MNEINEFDVQAYLNLLDISTPQKPILSFLNKLHERHLLTIPFENLDIHLGRPIVLTSRPCLTRSYAGSEEDSAMN